MITPKYWWLENPTPTPIISCLYRSSKKMELDGWGVCITNTFSLLNSIIDQTVAVFYYFTCCICDKILNFGRDIEKPFFVMFVQKNIFVMSVLRSFSFSYLVFGNPENLEEYSSEQSGPQRNQVRVTKITKKLGQNEYIE